MEASVSDPRHFFSGAHVLMRRFVGGVGVILMLHHVRRPRRDCFQRVDAA
jgi:hypothetical protein